jgi:hypothetical protein
MLSRISEHEVRLFLLCKQGAGQWRTADEAAVAAGMQSRTVRGHFARWTRLGLLHEARVFPSFRYRLVNHEAGPAFDYVQRIEEAKNIFGL